MADPVRRAYSDFRLGYPCRDPEIGRDIDGMVLPVPRLRHLACHFAGWRHGKRRRNPLDNREVTFISAWLAARRESWPRLIRRAYEVDPLLWRCGERMHIAGFLLPIQQMPKDIPQIGFRRGTGEGAEGARPHSAPHPLPHSGDSGREHRRHVLHVPGIAGGVANDMASTKRRGRRPEARRRTRFDRCRGPVRVCSSRAGVPSEEIHDQGSPAGLVAGSQSPAGLPMEILVEKQQVPPAAIVGE